jgi:hypothetical protein
LVHVGRARGDWAEVVDQCGISSANSLKLAQMVAPTHQGCLRLCMRQAGAFHAWQPKGAESKRLLLGMPKNIADITPGHRAERAN